MYDRRLSILSLHHVTATVDDAQDDLDFCVGGLGLRLVKKTVNFDNHHVYHFYYGDERGTPGTIWTTFPYKDRGVPVGTKGAGQITVTSFSVPSGSLAFWRARLGKKGVAVTAVEPRFGEPAVRCADRSGLTFELVASGRDRRTPWIASGFDAGSAVRGLHSITMVVRNAARTLDLMTSLLDWHIVDREGSRIRMGVNGSSDTSGALIDIAVEPDAPAAVNGLGTVHHVAMAIGSEAEQLALRDALIQYGCRVTEVRDRCYFKSIYFREPGGVLFEVATIQPGFSVDEDVQRLGRELKLPPWEEPHREDIEAHLVPVIY